MKALAFILTFVAAAGSLLLGIHIGRNEVHGAPTALFVNGQLVMRYTDFGNDSIVSGVTHWRGKAGGNEDSLYVNAPVLMR